jgi:hydroxymethylglutaryl-CoA reductase
VRVRCAVPAASLATAEMSGAMVRDGVAMASRFAERDPYRAATHNKGIMNGVDAVVMATGNDWRAVEAGAHAFAARNGRYEPLATWRAGDDGALHGAMEIPLALGIVGGTLRVHPGARLAM